MISHFVPPKKLIPVWSADSASPFGIWKKTFVNNHFTIFGNLEIIIIHCWKVKILSPSLQFINYLSDLSSVGNNIEHFLKENWLGYLKMSLLLSLDGQKGKKLKKTNWNMFYGTPCRTELGTAQPQLSAILLHIFEFGRRQIGTCFMGHPVVVAKTSLHPARSESHGEGSG